MNDVVKIISQNHDRNTEMVVINGKTLHRAIDPRKPSKFKPKVSDRNEIVVKQKQRKPEE